MNEHYGMNGELNWPIVMATPSKTQLTYINFREPSCWNSQSSFIISRMLIVESQTNGPKESRERVNIEWSMLQEVDPRKEIIQHFKFFVNELLLEQ